MKKISYSLLALLMLLGCQKQEVEEKRSMKLWYNEPAKDWFESLPLGNGRLGATVSGNVNEELLQLNEESLWAGCPENPYPEEVEKHYRKFQELNLEGKYKEALDYGLKYLAISPTSIRSYEPLGDLHLEFNHDQITNYKRELDLESGIVTITYEMNGQKVVRESFVSEEYDAVFYHFKTSGETNTDCKIHFDRAKDIIISTQNKRLNVDGQIFDDPDGFDDNKGGSGKGGYHMKFNAQIGIIPVSGEVNCEADYISVTNSSEFTMVLSAATDYNLSLLNFDRSISPQKTSEQILERALAANYKEVKRKHIEKHKSVFNRVELQLTQDVKDNIPTDKRLENLRNGQDDPYLAELVFQYGRYMLMASSGGNAKLPANLQGIWNKDMWAAWESDYHININLQMNYWPADICNLSETFDPLDAYMVKLAEAGKITARKYIGSKGWMAHHATNVFGRTTPNGSTPDSQVNNGYCFPLAGAWMSLSLWRHYEFTQDKEYLQNTVYPIIQGATQFILDFLVETEDGILVTAPSYSPENTYIHPDSKEHLRNTVAATMDIQIIRDVFNACKRAEEILGQNTLTDQVSKAVLKLPKMKIGANGTIQEWIEDYEEAEPGHRHISHLYGLHPSNQITQETPELFEAAKKTLLHRLASGGGQTGWSRAWMINFYARLFDGDECLKHINSLLAKQLTNNLFDLHPPHIFQIDGNLGACSGIAEMLLQSHEQGIIRLLPALPSKWDKGSVKGLKARGNFEVNIEWENGLVKTAEIIANTGGKTTILYNSTKREIDLKAGETYRIQI